MDLIKSGEALFPLGVHYLNIERAKLSIFT